MGGGGACIFFFMERILPRGGGENDGEKNAIFSLIFFSPFCLFDKNFPTTQFVYQMNARGVLDNKESRGLDLNYIFARRWGLLARRIFFNFQLFEAHKVVIFCLHRLNILPVFHLSLIHISEPTRPY